ncbi:metal ABC transporter permease [Candidatus Parcubacteria bacterium]|nr:metal ABC transporter permease [Candidatus Parcubacteria bacterium]
MAPNFLIILITGIFVGGISGYLGSLMLSRKMTIIVDPLSHLALPGVALALIFGKDVSLGAFLFLLVGTFLIWLLEQKTKLPTETIIAILFSTSLAIAFLFLDEHELHEALVGDISKIGILEGTITILVCLFVFLLLQKIYKKCLLISISEDLAKSEGIDLKKYQLLYLLSISAIVALGVKFVGGLLVAGLTALPAASARNLSKNLKTYKILSLLFGAISAIFGILIFKNISFPAGPSIILVSFVIFILSLFFKR